MNAVYESLLSRLLDACRQHYGDRLVSLAVYGSVGRGTPRADSDLDLLIVAERLPSGRVARSEEFRAVEDALGPETAALRAAGPRRLARTTEDRRRTTTRRPTRSPLHHRRGPPWGGRRCTESSVNEMWHNNKVHLRPWP
jgi:predicted nucleotidyltransferase